MTTRRRAAAVSVLMLGLLLPASAAAQDPPAAPLEAFVHQVARLWANGDVTALVALIPEESQLTLDTGAGIETANTRRAAAALRVLFADRQTADVSPARVTVSSSQPPRGFGELAWTFRLRGAPAEQSRSIYVGARWEPRGWRITELRLMP
jgi:hypothetical protein